MKTLYELKAAEVKLRESLRNEKNSEFIRDIRYAYRLVRARVRLAEAEAEIGVKI